MWHLFTDYPNINFVVSLYWAILSPFLLDRFRGPRYAFPHTGSFCPSLSLLLTVQETLTVCLRVPDCVWLWLCVTLSDCICFCLTVSNCVTVPERLWTTALDCLWLSLTAFDCLWLPLTVVDCLWLSLTAFECLWLSLTLSLTYPVSPWKFRWLFSSCLWASSQNRVQQNGIQWPALTPC